MFILASVFRIDRFMDYLHLPSETVDIRAVGSLSYPNVRNAVS
jgi:hypothetical protein